MITKTNYNWVFFFKITMNLFELEKSARQTLRTRL